MRSHQLIFRISTDQLSWLFLRWDPTFQIKIQCTLSQGEGLCHKPEPLACMPCSLSQGKGLCHKPESLACMPCSHSQEKDLVSWAWILGLHAMQPLIRKGPGVTGLNPACRKCWSLVIVSVEVQIGQCWIMNLITVLWAVRLMLSTPRNLIGRSTLLELPQHLDLCDTRPLFLAWSECGLGTRLRYRPP